MRILDRLPALLAATVLAATLATAPAAAQTQELFLLDHAGDIFRVDGYRTTQGTLVHVATVSVPNAGYRGLAIDPVTGDFLVLLSFGTGVRVDRIDRVSGARSLVCDLSGLSLLFGLDARADGTLYLESALQILILLDPATCAWDTVPLSHPIGNNTSFAAVTIDARGAVLGMGADGLRGRFDPLDGSSLPIGFPYFFCGVRDLEEDELGDVYLGTLAGELFRIESSTQALWQVAIGAPNGIAGLSFSRPVDGVGVTDVCDGAPNSTGVPSTLELLGTTRIADEDVDLRCRNLPPNTFGYFLMGPNSTMLPVGEGTLCVGSPQFRYSGSILSSGASGTVSFPIELTTLPSGSPAQAGDVFVFQYWHRDDVGQGPTSNFSPAAALTFL